MLSPVMLCFYFSYHYKLPFDVYAYTFDMCTNSLLTYLLTFVMRARTLVTVSYTNYVAVKERTREQKPEQGEQVGSLFGCRC